MDALDTKIRDILANFGLPTHDDAIARLGLEIDVLTEAARDIAAERMLTEDAERLEAALKTALRLCSQYQLATDEILGPLRHLLETVGERLSENKKPGPRRWVGVAAKNLQETWEVLTALPSGIHHRSDPSPTLEFVTECCRLIDPELSVHTVKRAYDDFRASSDPTGCK